MTKARTLADNFAADINQVNAGVGITGGGTSGTVTITNDMATTINAAGDLLYGTANDAYTRLGIGTAGQYLKVNSGATAPEWATLSAGGMTELASGSLTGSTVSLTSISGSYKNLQLTIRSLSVSTNAYVGMRINGYTSGYNIIGHQRNTSSSALFGSLNGSRIDFCADASFPISSAYNDNSIFIDLFDYASTNTKKGRFTAFLNDQSDGERIIGGDFVSADYSTAITSIDILTTAGTFDNGTYVLWGVS